MPKQPHKAHELFSPSTGAARLGRLLTKLFREHWKAVNAKLADGADVAAKRAQFFYASRDRECLKLARAYYAPVRAGKLAIASDDEILRLSNAWLRAFRDHVEYDSAWTGKVEGKERRDHLRQLIAAEYVAVSWLSPDPFDRPCEEVTNISPLPDETVGYGDIYEITASGYSCGAYLRVCKSVAEPFHGSERSGAMAGIKREFCENAADAGEEDGAWRIKFRKSKEPCLIEADILPTSKA
jgi:hypothetical protein